jgi:hypothetical protein
MTTDITGADSEHLLAEGWSTPLEAGVRGIAFLFRVTLRRPEIADQIEYIAEPQKTPLVVSPEEVRRRLDAVPGFKYRLLLSLTYGCGRRASEVVSLRVSDIDSDARLQIGTRGPRSLTPCRRGIGEALCVLGPAGIALCRGASLGDRAVIKHSWCVNSHTIGTAPTTAWSARQTIVPQAR